MKVEHLMHLTVDPSKPVEEIKACIAEISLAHGAKQLAILQEVDLWLGGVIAEVEQKIAEAEKNQTETKDKPIEGSA
jgi:hypothetical protein